MIEFYRENLLLISRVLLSRLTRPNTVEANIIQNHLLDQSSEPYINLERTLGRFVGCFLDCDDSVCFIRPCLVTFCWLSLLLSSFPCTGSRAHSMSTSWWSFLSLSL